MQQTRLPLAAAPARAGTARAGRMTRFLRRPPLAQQERHRRHQPRGKHRTRNDIPHHKNLLFRKMRNATNDVTVPHHAETSPGRLHHSAPCGTLPGTMFAFPRHAERRPDDIHASAPCGTPPGRYSRFRAMRKPHHDDVRLSALCGNFAGAIFDFPQNEEASPSRFHRSLF